MTLLQPSDSVTSHTVCVVRDSNFVEEALITVATMWLHRVVFCDVFRQRHKTSVA
jgi:hypothetical protein